MAFHSLIDYAFGNHRSVESFSAELLCGGILLKLRMATDIDSSGKGLAVMKNTDQTSKTTA